LLAVSCRISRVEGLCLLKVHAGRKELIMVHLEGGRTINVQRDAVDSPKLRQGLAAGWRQNIADRVKLALLRTRCLF
jgi:hypothetical protein